MPRFRSPRNPFRSKLSAVGFLVALLVPPVAAAEAGEAPALLRAPTANASPPAVRGTAGLRVFLDPVTGRIVSRPSSEQVRRLQQSIDELAVEPVLPLHPFYLHRGGTGVYVGDRFMSSTVVRRAPDGSMVIDCVSDPNHLRHHHPPLAPRASAHPETVRRSDAPVM